MTWLVDMPGVGTAWQAPEWSVPTWVFLGLVLRSPPANTDFPTRTTPVPPRGR